MPFWGTTDIFILNVVSRERAVFLDKMYNTIYLGLEPQYNFRIKQIIALLAKVMLFVEPALKGPVPWDDEIQYNLASDLYELVTESRRH